MNPALRALLAAGTPAPAAIDQFVGARRFPLIDSQGITFVFRGVADAVNLRLWLSGLPTTQPLARIGDSDLWVLHLEFPPGSRIEYKLELVRGGAVEWIVDPLNPLTAADPFGANSVAQGFGYERPDWTLPDARARSGTLDELEIASSAFAERRRIVTYVPARFRRTRSYPLLIVHDGEDYLRFASLKTVLDNLIDRLEIAPLIVALVQSPNRLIEYAGDERHGRFIAQEVLGLMRARYALEDAPGSRGLMGASFGAVASLSTAWRCPGVFGRLLLQSGSFAFSDIGEHRHGAVFDPVVRFVNAFRAAPDSPAEKMYLSCGIYESLIYENRSLVPLLKEHGIDVRYEEARDAHNWENWRDRLRAGLSWLFPGPLWMVYE